MNLCCKLHNEAKQISNENERLDFIKNRFDSYYMIYSIFQHDHSNCLEYFLLNFNIDYIKNIKTYLIVKACQYHSVNCLFNLNKRFPDFVWNSSYYYHHTYTPLEFAIMGSQKKETCIKLLLFLLDRGVNINFKNKFNKNRTPLFLAVCYQLDSWVNLLIENGADIHIKDNLNLTPIDLFLQYNSNSNDINVDLFQYLLNVGAKIKYKKITRFFSARNKNRERLIDIFCLFKKIDYLKILWILQEVTYNNYIQMLPNELLCDLIELLSNAKVFI